MPALDISALPQVQEPMAAWAVALLHALARDEAAGRRTQRLTEQGLGTWKRFRGRLTSVDLAELLFEDAAVLHPIPFAPAAVGGSFKLSRLSEPTVDGWIDAVLGMNLTAAGAEYILAQAKLLGISTRLARSDLHVVKPHQRVLELPGTGGQLAHHVVSSQRDLTLQDNCVIACSSWQELTLAGVVALDLGAPHTEFVARVDIEGLRDPNHPLRQRIFDFVVGLHPDKGGLFRIEEQLAIWFPQARVLLV